MLQNITIIIIVAIVIVFLIKRLLEANCSCDCCKKDFCYKDEKKSDKLNN
jgi:hypothetical protein